MSLTRYLPTPSDRMGILWTLLSVKDAIVLEYGTAGTTAYASRVLSFAGIDPAQRLFTTSFNEDNVVMGDTSNLENKIRELDRKYSPKVLFVMASSVSSVIGADIKGVVNEIRDSIKATIITFTQGGFGGDYSSGIQAAYTELVSHLTNEQYDRNESYNLLGISAMENSSRNDAAVIGKMMKMEFGLKANAVLSLDTSIREISGMSRARVNLVVSYEGLDAAEVLKERFGTPYVYGLPLGDGGTEKWLREVGDALGSAPGEGASESPEKPGNGEKAKVIIYADYDKAVALDSYLEELGAENREIICTHNIKKLNNARVNYYKTEKEKLNIFKNLDNTFILGDGILCGTADESNSQVCVSGQKLTMPGNDSSLLGTEGTAYIRKEYENYLTRI